jgi:multimeric flavodoxin WrbA
VKVVAFNGSPHKKGNTFLCLNLVCEELQAEGIKTEIIQLAPLKLQPCVACFKCAQKQDGRCHGVKDGLNDVLPKLWEADGVLLGSPTWFANVSGHAKNFIDRAGIVGRTSKANPLARKPAAAVVAVRRAGAVPVFDAINHFFLINEMIVPGGSYWNLAIGREPGDCLKDPEGVATFQSLGRNMAWLLKKLG